MPISGNRPGPSRDPARVIALGLAAFLGVVALGLAGMSFLWAGDLADWRLPGLAALAAIACNVLLMVAERLRR